MLGREGARGEGRKTRYVETGEETNRLLDFSLDNRELHVSHQRKEKE